MHSCHITILLLNVYFTTSNKLTKYLSVADVSSYSTRSLNIQKSNKIGKKRQFWVRHPYIKRQNEPIHYFLAGYFCISETHRCSNKRKKITGKTASGYRLFGKNTGPKKPICKPNPLYVQDLGPRSRNNLDLQCIHSTKRNTMFLFAILGVKNY